MYVGQYMCGLCELHSLCHIGTVYTTMCACKVHWVNEAKHYGMPHTVLASQSALPTHLWTTCSSHIITCTPV